MKEHFEAVLKSMDEQEKLHEVKLAEIKNARPAILSMLKEEEAKERAQSSGLFSNSTKYAAMGTKEAVLAVLAEATQPLSSGDIAQMLRDGGIRTQSSDFVSVINSTLANLKKEPAQAERLEDGWVAAKSVNSSWNSNATH